jgi:hypothetical protein
MARATLRFESDEPLVAAAAAGFAGAGLAAMGGDVFSSFTTSSDRAARAVPFASIAFGSGNLAAATFVSAVRGFSTGRGGFGDTGWLATAGGGAVGRVATLGRGGTGAGAMGFTTVGELGAMEATGGTAGRSLVACAGAAAGR